MRKTLLFFVLLLLLTCLGFALGEELTMGVGQPNVFARAGQEGVVYSSSDESVIWVTPETGLLKALKTGTCTITGRKDGENVYALNVTVLRAPEKLFVRDSVVYAMLGYTFEVQQAVADEGAYAGELEVRLTDPPVVRNADGTLSAQDIGTSVVYQYAYNGVFAKYEVKVCIKPTDILLEPHEVYLAVGETRDIACTLMPQYCFSRIQWTFESDGAVAFDEEKQRVTALGYGSATLTAMTENGLMDSVKISVLPLPEKLNAPAAIVTAEGQSGKLSGILPEGTRCALRYESLSPSVVSVTASGEWTAVGGGQGIVRVYADEIGDYVDQVFDIRPLPQSIELSYDISRLYIGQQVRCTVKLLPEGAVGNITFTSSYPGGVTVDGEGTISALSPGAAVISAMTDNGLRTSVTVSVLKMPASVTLNTNFAELQKGDTLALSCAFPVDSLAPVAYRSLDESVASVDAQTGLVTTIGGGSTLILAETENGVKDSCLISVTPEETGEWTLEAIFMDVTTNDAILLRVGDEYAFFDSGNHSYGEQCAARLKELGVTHLKYYIGTHAHLDHVGGAGVILDNFDVDLVIVPHIGVKSAIQRACYTESELKKAMNANYCILRHGQTVYLGNVSLKCLGPIGIVSVPSTDDNENSNSLVLRADIGEVSMLLTGDATISEFVGISKYYEREIDVDIFKNVHHAGTLSDSQIMTISPKITIFSTSSYNLPSDRYLQLLRDAGCEQIYFTCERFHGEIKLTTDGKDIAVYPQYEDNHVQWEKEHFGR